MKIAYCGYDFFFSCFEDLLINNHQIIKVFSFECDNKYNFNERLEGKAKGENISFTKNKITIDDIKDLEDRGCKLIVVAGYPYKIPTVSKILKVINIHPTLLPEGRGPWPLPHIILKRLSKTGVTIHKITDKWDSGDILIQDSFNVSEKDNLETISAKSQISARKILSKLLDDLSKYWDTAIPQIGVESYWKMPTIEERTIKWDMTVDEIDKIIRAFGKFESYAHFEDSDWLIQDAICWKENHEYAPGEVVHKMSKEIVIAAKDGLVCIRNYSLDEN